MKIFHSIYSTIFINNQTNYLILLLTEKSSCKEATFSYTHHFIFWALFCYRKFSLHLHIDSDDQWKDEAGRGEMSHFLEFSSVTNEHTHTCGNRCNNRLLNINSKKWDYIHWGEVAKRHEKCWGKNALKEKWDISETVIPTKISFLIDWINLLSLDFQGFSMVCGSYPKTKDEDLKKIVL